MENTIYEKCNNMLDMLLNAIANNNNNKIEIVAVELINFLISNDNEYEEVFENSSNKDYLQNKSMYKSIMMLIVLSKAYYVALYSYEHDIDKDYYEELIKNFEDLECNSIKNIFYDWKKYLKIIDYIEDFCYFYDNSYIYHNNAMELVIKKNKMATLLKINPFEILNFMKYKPSNKILKSEKIIQNFIDLYNSSLSCAIKDDKGEASLYESQDDYIIDLLKEKINSKYKSQDKIKEFYSCIFSNIYEGITVSVLLDHSIKKRYYNLVKEFINPELSFDIIYSRIMADNEFLLELIDYFLEINENLVDEELMFRRNNFKETGNIEILKKLNPFYNEEEKSFQKRKKIS